MSKKIILILAFILFSFLSNLAYADVVINEVKYSPISKQWIEIYNDGENAVDLTQYKILDAGASVNGHGISLCSGSLSANSYAIIAKVPDDFSNPSFTLCKSSLGIKSTADDTVILKIGSNVIDTVLVSEGSATSSNSLQLINSSWVASTPTPGEVNEASNDSSSSDSNSNNNEGESEEGVVQLKPKVVATPTMKAKILTNTLAFAGQPFWVDANISGYSGENVVLGRLYWNFGDGDAVEQVNNFEKFYHTYYYPGEYAVLLEYYPKSYSTIPEVTSKMIIKVLPTTVVISKVGDAKDFFIELSNNATSDIDISNWVINANGKIFIFPKNSVIMSKKSMIVSGRITGFTYDDRYNLKLLSSTGELIFTYGVPSITSKTLNKTTVAGRQISPTVIQSQETEGILEEEISVENLEASAIEDGVTGGNIMRTYFLTTIFTVFLGVSASTVYFIRRKRSVSVAGDDFKILDE